MWIRTEMLSMTVPYSPVKRLAVAIRTRTEAMALDHRTGRRDSVGGRAATYGCQVIGVDLSETFIDAARYLTERTGQSAQVSFETASALELPFDDNRFDVALLQHVAMNISDRARLYREILRVLKSGGKFATFEVVLNGGDPWARTPATSFLLTAAATREAIEAAGFRTLACQDDSEAAKAWITQLRASGAPPSPNLGLAALAGELGATYAIPIIYVPLLMITHVVAFYLLARPQPGTARVLAVDVPATI
jgi:SAM-dependent methyltransferase